MIVDKETKLPSDDRGVSVIAIDPGQTTGWAWAALGHREIREMGVHDALQEAGRHKSGLLLADSRLAHGQVPAHYSGGPEGIGIAEAQAAEELVAMMQVHGEMSQRVSGGAVPRVTDIVIEDFVLRKRTMTRDLLSPVRITAALYVLLHQHPWRFRLHLQSSSDKSVIKDESLKKMGLWFPGQIHARDAARHLLLWLRAQPVR